MSEARHVALALLRETQGRLTRQQSYRASPLSGTLDEAGLTLTLPGSLAKRVEIRIGERYLFTLTVAEPPMPPPSMIRLAALLRRKTADADIAWLEEKLPAGAINADAIRAGGALMMRFELDSMPDDDAFLASLLQQAQPRLGTD